MYTCIVIAVEGCCDTSRAQQFDVHNNTFMYSTYTVQYECVFVEREIESEGMCRGREEGKKLVHMYMCGVHRFQVE